MCYYITRKHYLKLVTIDRIKSTLEAQLAKPFFKVWMVATSILKAKAKTLSSMVVLNSVLGIDTVPALPLPKVDIAQGRLLCISIVFEMHESLWEHKHVPSEELVGCVHKPHLKGTMSEEEKLSRGRVCVGWVDAPSWKFNDDIWHTLSIKGWKLHLACLQYPKGIRCWVCSNKDLHPGEGEEAPINRGYIWWYYEVRQNVRVTSLFFPQWLIGLLKLAKLVGPTCSLVKNRWVRLKK